ncbi:hypothetical protein [Pollutimonas subterranea]|uniref:hypothetical protein n=1 Tax=Pollutimonas subterranea TaxID=2045210 RepID=UPI00117D865A|nr:hypothetical protein [Pollutimonas subterranea]
MLFTVVRHGGGHAATLFPITRRGGGSEGTRFSWPGFGALRAEPAWLGSSAHTGYLRRQPAGAPKVADTFTTTPATALSQLAGRWNHRVLDLLAAMPGG